MKNTRLKWLFLFSLLIIAGILGIAFSGTASFVIDKTVVPGDAAWMLTATALVLIMTPGVAFFYGGMIQPKNIISTITNTDYIN